jgi:NADPH:quinone reductase-like Zn-dependent oxidoreductase
MRAVEFNEYGPPSVLRVAEVEEPQAGPGQVRVAVRASGVSPGETIIRSGRFRDVVPASFPWRTGFDAAGTIDQIGDDVRGVTVGDEVFGLTSATGRAANADFAVLTAWAPKPAGWSWAEAGGAAGAVETATRVLDRLEVGPGDTVLIQGAAGGTGSVVVQFAVARGATVIGTASPANHEFLRSLGAVPTTYGNGLVERVRGLASSSMKVVDCAGGAAQDLVRLAGSAGRVVTIVPDPEAAALGVHLSASAVPGGDAPALNGLDDAVKLAAEGRLRIPVAATFPLAEVATAHELSETRHARGKIVLLH